MNDFFPFPRTGCLPTLADEWCDEWDQRDAEAYEWCDECGDPLAEGEGIGIDAVPGSLVWKDIGESAVLCQSCLDTLGWTLDDWGQVEQIDLNIEGDPTRNGAW